MIQCRQLPRVSAGLSAEAPRTGGIEVPCSDPPAARTQQRTAGGAAPEFVIAARLTARLGRCTARLVPRLADAAMRLMRIEGWKPLHFTTVSDFARERLDRSGSWLRQMARLGQACQEMPALADAITGTDGGKPLDRAAAYEICRVARPETVTDWIQRARQGTVRDLKRAIRSTQKDGTSSLERLPVRHASLHVPAFLPGAILDVERAFQATNPGSRRCDLLEALMAEHASGSSSGMIDVGTMHASGMESKRTAAARSDRSGCLRSPTGLRAVPGSSEPRGALGMLEPNILSDGVEDTTTNRELLQARWTLHRVQMFVDSLEEEGALEEETLEETPETESGDPTGVDTSNGLVSDTTCRATDLVQSMRDILSFEHEITLRMDRLLLWLDHRRAWSLLGYAGAAEFGLDVLDESPSTTRNRLRLARALEHSTALRRGAESGRVSHHRLVRLAQLTQQRKLDEVSVQQWVDHAPRIRIKRMDEELDALERCRWGSGGCTGWTSIGHGHNEGHEARVLSPDDAPSRPPLPLSDAEWQASLRLATGDARRHLLMGALHALATDASANVCWRFTAPANTLRDLRHSLNVARIELAQQARHLVESRRSVHGHCRGRAHSPADESRLLPSLRLAARHLEGGTPIPDWICLLSLLEEFVEEWDNPRHVPSRPTDAIAARDGWRCTAPGCTSREIEVHHIVYRTHGGSDDPSNLTSLCPFHHRMGEHGGLLKVTGTAPLNLRWQIGGLVFMNEKLVGVHGEPERHGSERDDSNHTSAGWRRPG